MKLLSLFQSRCLKPSWTYVAHGTIWRVLVTERGRIIGECRNREQKRVSFFCLDGETGTVQWDNVAIAEPWWVGIESVQADILLLHGFAKPDMPGHRGIRAIDIETGRERWHNDELTYWFGQGDTVYAYRDTFEKRIGYALDLGTGVIKRTYDEMLEELHVARRQAIKEDASKGLHFPEVLAPDAVEPEIRHLLSRAFKRERLAGDLENVREGDFLVVSYHTTVPQHSAEPIVFDNHLRIFDLGRRRTILSEILVSGAKAPVPDSFFLRPPFVYYIKDYSILKAVRLWTS